MSKLDKDDLPNALVGKIILYGEPILRRMNKTLLTIAILGLLTLFTSAYYTAPADSRIGYKAPQLVLGNNNNNLSPLQQYRGENVLLTFWTSADARSRLENMRYDRLSRMDDASFVHVSVNLDRSENVFKSIVDLDNLDRSAHFTAASNANQIIKAWRLNEGFHTFLIDRHGKIVAVDPTDKDLAAVK